MPNTKRASRWPINLLEEIFRDQDVDIDSLPPNRTKALDVMLDRILPVQKKIILLFYKDGYTVKEINQMDPSIALSRISEAKKYGIMHLQRYSHMLIIGLARYLGNYKILEWPVGLFFDNLSPVSYRAILNAGISTVSDILNYSRKDLLALDGVEYVAVNKITSKLRQHGLSLKRK